MLKNADTTLMYQGRVVTKGPGKERVPVYLKVERFFASQQF